MNPVMGESRILTSNVSVCLCVSVCVFVCLFCLSVWVPFQKDAGKFRLCSHARISVEICEVFSNFCLCLRVGLVFGLVR